MIFSDKGWRKSNPVFSDLLIPKSLIVKKHFFLIWLEKEIFKKSVLSKVLTVLVSKISYFNHLPVLKTHWELLPCNLLEWCNCLGCIWAFLHLLLFQRTDHFSLQLLVLLFAESTFIFSFQESFLMYTSQSIWLRSIYFYGIKKMLFIFYQT